MSTCLQMGHVPRTRGATGAPGEQAYNRAVAADAAPRLRAAGEVTVIIGADAGVPRTNRFVAIHYDGSNNPSARGASVGYRPGRSTTAASRTLAHRWKAAYQRLGFSGGFRSDNYTSGLSGYYGTGRAHAAGTPVAFILEGGFGSHPQEGPWLRSPAGISTCARAIAAAVTGSDTGPVNPPPSGPRTLRLTAPTMTGDDVKTWQVDLSRWLGDPARPAQDGAFGPETNHVTQTFMRDEMGVETNSPAVGPKTLEAMQKALAGTSQELRHVTPNAQRFWQRTYDHYTEAGGSPTSMRHLLIAYRAMRAAAGFGPDGKPEDVGRTVGYGARQGLRLRDVTDQLGSSIRGAIEGAVTLIRAHRDEEKAAEANRAVDTPDPEADAAFTDASGNDVFAPFGEGDPDDVLD